MNNSVVCEAQLVEWDDSSPVKRWVDGWMVGWREREMRRGRNKGAGGPAREEGKSGCKASEP